MDVIVLYVMDGYDICGKTFTFWEVASSDMTKFRKKLHVWYHNQSQAYIKEGYVKSLEVNINLVNIPNMNHSQRIFLLKTTREKS